MKLFTSVALLSTALLAHAATIPGDLAGSLESRANCSPPEDGRNTCGNGFQCDGPGIFTCSPAGQIVAIACCGPNGCKEISEQPLCI